jgi:hypothetical protein
LSSDYKQLPPHFVVGEWQADSHESDIDSDSYTCFHSRRGHGSTRRLTKYEEHSSELALARQPVASAR